ncbi:MAG: hypothetical protein WCW77_01310 [Patescibacteria group bacterium]|jgi:hypothetical protein
MKITTEKQIKKLEYLIGPENAESARYLLASGGELWVFRSFEELEKDEDLSEQKKVQCWKMFVETGGKYAAWYRLPENKIKFSSGFTSDPGDNRVRFNCATSGATWSH